MRIILACVLLLPGCGVLNIEHSDGEMPDVTVQTEYCDQGEVDVGSGEVVFVCTIKF